MCNFAFAIVGQGYRLSTVLEGFYDDFIAQPYLDDLTTGCDVKDLAEEDLNECVNCGMLFSDKEEAQALCNVLVAQKQIEPSIIRIVTIKDIERILRNKLLSHCDHFDY